MATSKLEKKEQLYEGKAKVLFATNDPDYVIQYFKDDATAFNAEKKGTIENKGVVNNTISAVIFKYLEAEGVKTHFVEQLSERESLTRYLEIIPVEVIVRNITAGSISKRLGVEEGIVLKQPILEFCYKDDDLGDPFICESIIYAFDYATPEEMKHISETALKVNELLSKFFDERGITLVDYKLEFGRFKGEVLLADEITPDGCRLWEKGTNEKLDKDRFRRDLGNIEEAYEKVLNKVME
ncbi:Phosphoribosylaminoimidazole-succinocarboxamide synthase [hydrothermal vent metagenome]|uniref:phosphoribosylaminoimidazolesuccinocarboxamide synthase n=1 Tax=hydrothermal vent metagenome TaxID=652676 RepID=A0A3B0V4H5_9ZZZZ